VLFLSLVPLQLGFNSTISSSAFFGRKFHQSQNRTISSFATGVHSTVSSFAIFGRKFHQSQKRTVSSFATRVPIEPLVPLQLGFIVPLVPLQLGFIVPLVPLQLGFNWGSIETH
jgi:hypothetical protein